MSSNVLFNYPHLITKDFLLLNSKNLTNELKNRLKLIAADCNQVSDFNFDNTVYFVIYYKSSLKLPNNDDSEKINFIDSKFTTYTSYFRFIRYPNHLELYDVCTLKSVRNQKHMSQLFDSFLKEYSKFNTNFIWLVIKLSNPLLKNLIYLYCKKGFHTPKITSVINNFPAQYVDIGFYFLELKYDGKNLSDQNRKDTIKQCFKLTTNFLGFDTMNNNLYNVSIQKDSLSFINDLMSLEETVETGGCFDITNINDGDIEISIIKDGLLTGSETKLAVENPQLEINFHTHSIYCYTTKNCNAGWPSHVDFALVFLETYLPINIFAKQLKNMFIKLHLVPSVEGIYYFYLNKFTKGVLNRLFELDTLSSFFNNIYKGDMPINSDIDYYLDLDDSKLTTEEKNAVKKIVIVLVIHSILLEIFNKNISHLYDPRLVSDTRNISDKIKFFIDEMKKLSFLTFIHEGKYILEQLIKKENQEKRYKEVELNKINLQIHQLTDKQKKEKENIEKDLRIKTKREKYFIFMFNKFSQIDVLNTANQEWLSQPFFILDISDNIAPIFKLDTDSTLTVTLPQDSYFKKQTTNRYVPPNYINTYRDQYMYDEEKEIQKIIIEKKDFN